ncbi:MAG TPA: ROK family protein [Actinomycetota bacterium]|nr:ROK family protein [Actinomycetota bacterium]
MSTPAEPPPTTPAKPPAKASARRTAAPPKVAGPAAPAAVPVEVASAVPVPVTGATTLAIDIGGTGIKASVLDAGGVMLVDRVRVPTPYPLPPDRLVATLVKLVGALPAFDRVSAGFPGMVRGGVVLSSPHFVTASGPGTKVVPDLVKAWQRFDLAAALTLALGKPARVANDADLQGAEVVSGKGLEVVITLGTGLGTALFDNGHLLPHMELAHHPFRKGEDYDEQVGEEARKRIGDKKWSKRVARAVQTIDALLFFDHLYVGGGNSHRLTVELGDRVTIVDNVAGITGGIKLWDV